MAQIRIQGEEAPVRAAEAALREVLLEQFGVDAATQAVEPELRVTRDLVAAVSLALSIPGAVIAAMDLAQRLELVPKLRRLIGFAAEQKRANHMQLLIDVGDGSPRPLDSLTPEQIIDYCFSPRATPAKTAPTSTRSRGVWSRRGSLRSSAGPTPCTKHCASPADSGTLADRLPPARRATGGSGSRRLAATPRMIRHGR
jgi:hypothetical protein